MAQMYVFLILIFIIVLILSFQSLMFQINKLQTQVLVNSIPKVPIRQEQVSIEQNSMEQEQPQTDVIRNYDYRKVYDPLENPVRRVDRSQLPPYYVRQVIDIPSRGYPDNFTQVGILVKKDNFKKDKKDNNRNEDNKILRLFGRQEYPGSSFYEYYTALNSGLDSIKIPIKNRRNNELYTGDEVYIKEINQKYEVSLHKYDAPKYYPDIL
jgi:hypothetical protein